MQKKTDPCLSKYQNQHSENQVISKSNDEPSFDKKNAKAQKSLAKSKRQKCNEESEPTQTQTSSLFDGAEPIEPDENVQSQFKKVTYIEKRTKENTYVEGGYFVVEESNEYVQVDKVEPAKNQTFRSKTMLQSHLNGNNNNISKSDGRTQASITSFFGR